MSMTQGGAGRESDNTTLNESKENQSAYSTLKVRPKRRGEHGGNVPVNRIGTVFLHITGRMRPGRGYLFAILKVKASRRTRNSGQRRAWLPSMATWCRECSADCTILTKQWSPSGLRVSQHVSHGGCGRHRRSGAAPRCSVDERRCAAGGGRRLTFGRGLQLRQSGVVGMSSGERALARRGVCVGHPHGGRRVYGLRDVIRAVCRSGLLCTGMRDAGVQERARITNAEGVPFARGTEGDGRRG